MRVLVVYAHPLSDSFAAALRDAVLRRLRENGYERFSQTAATGT